MIIWRWFIKAIKYLVIAALVVLGARIAYVDATTFNKSYYCVGKEKVFYPKIENLKYVAFDAPNPSETHELKFVLNIDHKSRWFADEDIWFQAGYYMIFETDKNPNASYDEFGAIYNQATKSYVGHDKRKFEEYQAAEFSPSSKKFTAIKSFYDGGAIYQTRLQANVVRAAEAQCTPY